MESETKTAHFLYCRHHSTHLVEPPTPVNAKTVQRLFTAPKSIKSFFKKEASASSEDIVDLANGPSGAVPDLSSKMSKAAPRMKLGKQRDGVRRDPQPGKKAKVQCTISTFFKKS